MGEVAIGELFISFIVGFASGFTFNKIISIILFLLVAVALGEYFLPPNYSYYLHNGFTMAQYKVFSYIHSADIQQFLYSHVKELWSSVKHNTLSQNSNDINEIVFLIGLLLGFKVR